MAVFGSPVHLFWLLHVHVDVVDVCLGSDDDVVFVSDDACSRLGFPNRAASAA